MPEARSKSPSVGHEEVVYTDGSCLGNPGPGGWAWAVPDGAFASGGDPSTTNQRMELRAVLEAVVTLGNPSGSPLVVVSDSNYVVKCFQDRWWQGWVRRGWRNSAGKPVANRDLWEPLLGVVSGSVRPISFRWVKGHSGERWNDFVDELAVSAAIAVRGS
ncbi:MAG: ribonuclease H family protein [Acidimicrobiales bacterium]